ncbi:MAG: dCTP deaminase [Thermofilum sp.]|jgi:dCTP deaminase|uniref:Deoxycytidine triphosphate deaminase n=2 Tax=Thermofilum adornatum TaxID=1365176 RepID=S5ZIR1_9CREN|nr:MULTISPECIES: dCTP deaminase [Thermofilum]AGT34391.1 deoxycytidine triphosphate deaminase [Thermofilum adornatum]AJB42454.1 Deoxycytidine triphosphate deaminase [Thermofilum adornatum 1505]MCC5998203.1 dCTP deaminase [Thermofilum sp.]MCI4407869.1 dCTP deaminase [Thermofilum sp.]NAZ25321.1 dCTP deaminase [Thermofilum sp.]
MLSGAEIKKLIKEGKLKIEPYSEEIVRENGVDLRIGDEIAILLNNPEPIDPEKLREIDLSQYYKIFKADNFVLQPYMKVLVTTLEYIKMPEDVGALIGVRSTFARLGVSVPPTLIDAGFEGQVTIEIHGGAFPIILRKGQRFAHVAFYKLVGEPVPYKGRYQGQRGVTLPK